MIFKCIMFLLFLVATKATTSDNETEIDNSWKELNQRFHISEEKNIVLIIGPTGSGKSTLTLLLTDTYLTAVETFPDSGYYLIEDENGKIRKTTSESHTVIPEPKTDPESLVTYYDCPGLEDTKPELEIEIANQMIQLLKEAKTFKILLVVNKSAVQRGEENSIFPYLVRYVITLFKDFYKYKDSIALVATKVENIYDEDNLEQDTVAIQRIASYLEHEKTLTAEDNRDPKLSQENRRYNDEKIKLINALLQKSPYPNNEYERIGIFREPEEEGSLEGMENIQKNKNDIKKMINERLQFRKNDGGSEFGYVLSPGAIKEENKLFQQILTLKLNQHILDACDEMKIHYKRVFNEETDYEELNKLHENIEKSLNSISYIDPLVFTRDLIRVAEEITPKVFIKHLQRNIGDIASNLNFQDETLIILGEFRKHIDNVKQFVLSKYETRIEYWIRYLLIIQLPTAITGVINDIEEYYINFEKKTHDLDKLRNEISDGHQTLFKVNINDPQTLMNATQKLGVLLSEENSIEMNKVVERFAWYKSMEKKHPELMAKSKAIVEKATHQLKNAKLWYDSLVEVYSDLCSFHFQTPEKEHTILEGLLRNAESAVEVRDIGFELLKSLTKKEYSTLKNIGDVILDPHKLNALRAVLSESLMSPTITCSEDKLIMMVTGNIIRMSSVVADKNCWQTSKYVEIFARDSVVIDSDVEKFGSGNELVIMSPVWSIIEKKVISLTGDDGKSKDKAKDGEIKNNSPGHGEDGEAGNPGGPGGIILGIGEVFVNAQDLTIRTNGGNGGPGQDGGHGAVGLADPNLSLAAAKKLLYTCLYFVNLQIAKRKECYKMYLKKLDFSLESMGWLDSSYRSFYVRGGPGINGGDGGDGGAAGFGGLPGRIEVIELGNLGSGGMKGLGGHSAIRTVVEITVHYPKFGEVSVSEKTIADPVYPTNESGKDGQDNTSHKNRSASVPAVYLCDPSVTIDRFKKFIAEKSENNIRESKLEKFISLLENDSRIREFYE